MNKTIAVLFSSLLMSGFVLAQDQSSLAVPAAATTTTTTTETTSATTETAVAPAAATPIAVEVKEKRACCATQASGCAKVHMKKCCHDVLTPEERHHFCDVKCKVLATNPSLKDKKKKRELCDAILKEDPSLKPILDKLKKHCQEEHQKKKVEQSTTTSLTK